MARIDVSVLGTKEISGELQKMITLTDKKFTPFLTKALAEEGAMAIRDVLKPRRFRGNILLSGVFSKRSAGGNADLFIRGDAAWFEEGVPRHPVSLLKMKNEPLITWAKAKGMDKTRSGRPRGILWVHTPRLRLSKIAENRIRMKAPSVGRKVWNKVMK